MVREDLSYVCVRASITYWVDICCMLSGARTCWIFAYSVHFFIVVSLLINSMMMTFTLLFKRIAHVILVAIIEIRSFYFFHILPLKHDPEVGMNSN